MFAVSILLAAILAKPVGVDTVMGPPANLDVLVDIPATTALVVRYGGITALATVPDPSILVTTTDVAVWSLPTTPISKEFFNTALSNSGLLADSLEAIIGSPSDVILENSDFNLDLTRCEPLLKNDACIVGLLEPLISIPPSDVGGVCVDIPVSGLNGIGSAFCGSVLDGDMSLGGLLRVTTSISPLDAYELLVGNPPLSADVEYAAQADSLSYAEVMAFIEATALQVQASLAADYGLVDNLPAFPRNDSDLFNSGVPRWAHSSELAYSPDIVSLLFMEIYVLSLELVYGIYGLYMILTYAKKVSC